MRTSLLVATVAAAVVAGSADAVRTAAPTLTVRSSAYGRILFDGKGRALYAFTRDKRGGKSTCYGACAKAWPPYVVRGRLAAGTGTKRSLLGTVKRRDGSRQVTYAGRPLYYYVADGRGEVKCQNVNEFGGLWLVVRATGKLVR
jgi:predicted lipoprotein with Yx(FWY)xxD motif